MSKYKSIPVSPILHERIKRIAKENFRGLGGQIAFWVNADCLHPDSMRVAAKICHLASDEKLAVGFICQHCKRFVFSPGSEPK